MGELAKLKNIGKIVEEQLNQVGIYNKDELEKVGSKNAWLKIRAIDSSACLNRLYALEGAIQDIRWHNLEENIKTDLKLFYTEVNG